MADSIRKVPDPEGFEQYTEFMKRCIDDQVKGFKRDGSRVDSSDAFKSCRLSWVKRHGYVPSIGGSADVDELVITQDGMFVLTQDFDYLRF